MSMLILKLSVRMSLRRSGRNKEPLQGVESSAGPIQDVENTNEDASREKEDIENTNATSMLRVELKMLKILVRMLCVELKMNL